MNFSRLTVSAFLLLSLLILLCACSFQAGGEREVLNTTYEEYLAFKNEVEAKAQEINESPDILAHFNTNQPLDLSSEPLFSLNRYYDIQGNAVDKSGETLRDTPAYQRLMGHMEFFSTIAVNNDEIVLRDIGKLMQPDPFKFVGINQLDAPLSTFLNRVDLPENMDVLLIDPSKNIINLTDLKAVEVKDMSEELHSLIQAASLPEAKEDEITLPDEELDGTYLYKSGDGFTIAVKR